LVFGEYVVAEDIGEDMGACFIERKLDAFEKLENSFLSGVGKEDMEDMEIAGPFSMYFS
jgi:hypothetical protein